MCGLFIQAEALEAWKLPLFSESEDKQIEKHSLVFLRTHASSSLRVMALRFKTDYEGTMAAVLLRSSSLVKRKVNDDTKVIFKVIYVPSQGDGTRQGASLQIRQDLRLVLYLIWKVTY